MLNWFGWLADARLHLLFFVAIIALIFKTGWLARDPLVLDDPYNHAHVVRHGTPEVLAEHRDQPNDQAAPAQRPRTRWMAVVHASETPPSSTAKEP